MPRLHRSVITAFVLLQLTSCISPLFADETISVTGSVPAQASNFPTSLSSTTSGTVPQNTQIDYQITYGSTLTYSSSFSVVASWTEGTISGASSPSVDVLGYVSGSASNGYGSTPAVIDTVNRTITWTFSSFPANTTSQTLTFSLKTTDNYTGAGQVAFTVSAHTQASSVTTTDSTVNQTYLYVAPAASPTATPLPGPTTTPAPVEVSIQNITLTNITASEAAIAVTTSKNTTMRLSYGTATNTLLSTLIDLAPATGHLVKLSGLSPDTRYFFRVNMTDTTGRTVTSDLYTFITARVTNAPVAENASIIFASGNTILYAFDPTKSAQEPFAVIPYDTTYTFRVHMIDTAKILSAVSVVRNARVLADTTFSPNDSVETPLTEFQPGFFTGTFHSPNQRMQAALFVRITDSDNNITEVKAADIRIVTPFTVLAKDTGRPIEHAKVALSVFNETTHTYRSITPDVLPIKNPLYTRPDGTISRLSLPLGSYRAIVSAIGFTDRTIDFTIGEQPTEDYPTVRLERQPFSVISAVTYLAGILTDTASLVSTSLQSLAGSNRFFGLLAFTVLFCFILLTFISFGLRLELALTFLPWFVWFRIRSVFSHAGKETAVAGRVIEKRSDKPVVHANVYVISALGNKLLAHTKTNRFGQFLLAVKPCKEYVIKLDKVGFLNPPSQTFSEKTMTSGTVVLSLQKRLERTHPVIDLLLEELGALIGFSFEVLLGVSIILEITLGNTLGWIPVLPFLLLSLVNLCLWLFHVRQLKQHHYVM